jgi:O-antigen/teichoic acid export membrane protein
LHWRCGFRWLAVAHVGCVLLGIALVLWDARRSPVFPTLHEWDAREARQMVRPSFFFGLTTLNFLVLYEAPLLILQWTLGPVAVVTFATTRTLFSAARQLLTPVQLAVQQELPRALNAEPGQLRQLYRFSESVALVGGCVLITGFALVSPWLMQHWLHGRVEPSLPLLALMASVTLATILKDNRNNLPLATNCHERSTLLVGGGYILMTVLGFGLAHVWGEPGLLGAWLVTELVLATLLQRQNFAQFGWGQAPSLLVPVGLTLGIGVTVFYALTWSRGVPLYAQMACAVLLAALSGVVALGLLGEGIVKPTQRALMALNLGRQEG